MINDERSKLIITSRAPCLTVHFVLLQGIRMESLHTWREVNANKVIMRGF